MRTALADRRVGLAVSAVLLALLAALAALQWKWIGEVGDLERRRLEERLREAGVGFGRDFDREIARLFLAFHPESGESEGEHERRLPSQIARWRADAEWPALLGALDLLRRGSEGAAAELARFDETSGSFAPLAWPPQLRPLAERLAEERRRAAERGGFFGFPHATLPGAAAIVLPFVFPTAGDAAGGREPRFPTLLLLELDRRVIREQVLPALAERHFGDAAQRDYDLAVLDPHDPGAPIYAHGGERGLEPRTADLAVPIFGLRPFEELRSPRFHGEGPPERRESPADRRPTPRLPRFGGPAGGPERDAGGEWLLLARRRDGSLEEAVAHARRHNLAVSGGILAVLAAAIALVLVSAERARRLARQQLEFVAGVTHELHTPLAAIRAAGENLADGVVRQPEQVRRYGEMVRAEGRRLSSMVEQMLELAGIESGRRGARREAVDVAAAIAGAIADTRRLGQERGVEIETQLAADLPAALADPAGLQRALRNLIENAVKYGGAGGWVGITAGRCAAGGVEIAVADRGPGIAAEDLPRIFEPFFRGRDASATAPGSGLGLALVRQLAELHGGEVRVSRPASGPGAVFALRLPAAAAPRVAVAESPA